MTKKERLQATISRQPVDRPPVALWRHFPGDDQRAEDLAAATVAFQQRHDFDFVKVTPASSFCIRDWGAKDRWVGVVDGTREYTHQPIQEPEDWFKLRPLDPNAGALGEQLRCLGLIREALGDGVPVIQTVFSPLSQAKNLVGPDQLPVHLRAHPGALRAGLAVIAETTASFVEAVCEMGVDGVFYAVQHARYGVLGEQEYRDYAREQDLAILQAAGSLWLNVMHAHGENVMFDLLAGYPCHVINWHDRETEPSLAEGKERFCGAVCGGLQRWKDVVRGTPEAIRAQAAEAIEQTKGRGLILGTGCVTPIVAPQANIRAVRQAVEG